MYIATIDSGTTNTRTRIWLKGAVVGEACAEIGVRNTAIDGNNSKLTMAIANTLQKAIVCAGIMEKDLRLVLATGMLTSNVGLWEIPHIVAPTGINKLAAAMVSRKIPEICSQEIWFVPGVKNFANEDLIDENINLMDIMRGEEVEVYGAFERVHIQGPAVLVLPGSHNKYIAVDENNCIVGCMTTVAGELIHSLTFDTIIADAVQRSFAKNFCEEAFLKGVDCYHELGLGRAVFMARILNQFQNYQAEAVQNYLLGLILSDDIRALENNPLFKKYESAPVIVAGKPVIQAAYQALLTRMGRNIILLNHDEQSGLSGIGAIAVAKVRGLI